MSKTIGKGRETKLALYRKQGKIYAKSVSGRFNRLRWLAVWLTQIVFFGGCWLTWESQGQIRPALLIDIPHEKLYLFGLVLWPQDALLLAFTLILAATGLFFVTALAGRLFCGFVCPQTVYSSLFSWIETRVEGDHLTRMKRDQAPWNMQKALLKASKHGLWLLFAAWTAITFVGYFTPIRSLLAQLPALEIGPWEGFWLIFYGAFTYVQAGLTREAVCQHMCPYSRFQGVMFDPATRTVAYDARRGEPRGGHRQSAAGGDCVDCGICVQVCPTGIDIRDGLQYQCINCGLCIDACEPVMAKTGRPGGLIRFISENELSGQPSPPRKRARPRVLVYGLLLGLFSVLLVWQLATRPRLMVDVLRDRGASHRESSDGRIENAYVLKLMNLTEFPRNYEIQADGLPGLALSGGERVRVAPGAVQVVSLTASMPMESGFSGIQPIRFLIHATDDESVSVKENSRFILP